MRKYTQGFTLIELLVVIAIIGILSTIVFAALNESRERSRNAAIISQVKEYQKAIELFYSNNGYYPATNYTRTTRYCIGNVTDDCMGSLASASNPEFAINLALSEHISSLPRVRQTQGSLNYSSPAYSGCSGSGMANTSCTTQDYSFWFFLEGTNGDCDGADVANPSVSGEYTLCRVSSK